MNSKVGFDTWTATSTTKYVNVGFRPKVIYFLANHMLGDGVESANFDLSFGISTATVGGVVVQVVFAQKSIHDALTPTARRYHKDDAVMSLMDNALVEQATAALLSVDDTGFTVDFTLVTGNEERFSYMAWGGDDMQEQVLDSFEFPATPSGTIDVHCGFLPSSILFITDWLTDAHGPSDELFIDFNILTRSSYSPNADKSVSTSGRRGYPNGYIYSDASAIMQTYDGTYLMRGKTNSYLADGFVFTNYTTTGMPPETGQRFYYLALLKPREVSGYPSYLSTGSRCPATIGQYTEDYKNIRAVTCLWYGGNQSAAYAPPYTSGNNTSIDIGFVDETGNQAVFYATHHKNTSGDTKVKGSFGQDDSHIHMVYDWNHSSPYTSFMQRTVYFVSWWPYSHLGWILNQDGLKSGLTGTYDFFGLAAADSQVSGSQGYVV